MREGNRTYEDREHHEEDKGQHEVGGATTTHTTALQQGHQTNKRGDADTKQEDADTQTGCPNPAALPALCHPPPNDSRPLVMDEGKDDRRIPHYTKTSDTDIHTTHHTPGKEQYTT